MNTKKGIKTDADECHVLTSSFFQRLESFWTLGYGRDDPRFDSRQRQDIFSFLQN